MVGQLHTEAHSGCPVDVTLDSLCNESLSAVEAPPYIASSSPSTQQRATLSQGLNNYDRSTIGGLQVNAAQIGQDNAQVLQSPSNVVWNEPFGSDSLFPTNFISTKVIRVQQDGEMRFYCTVESTGQIIGPVDTTEVYHHLYGQVFAQLSPTEVPSTGNQLSPEQYVSS